MVSPAAAKPAKSVAWRTSRPAARPLPVVIPQQFAPPQEAYASLPEFAAAAAAAKPSACQVAPGARSRCSSRFPFWSEPGECGATDAVLMDTIILPDQTKVAVTPPATMRCPMAEAVAHWVREDVAAVVEEILPPLRGARQFRFL